MKQTQQNEWNYHFVLVKPIEVHQVEDIACHSSKADLDTAFKTQQNGGTDYDLAEYLRGKGYVSVSDFKIVKEQVQ